MLKKSWLVFILCPGFFIRPRSEEIIMTGDEQKLEYFESRDKKKYKKKYKKRVKYREIKGLQTEK